MMIRSYGLDIEQANLNDLLGKLTFYLKKETMSKEEWQNCVFIAVQQYGKAGYDTKALALADTVDSSYFESLERLFFDILHLRALMNTGNYDKAIGQIEDLYERTQKLTWKGENQPSVKSGALVEIGKSCLILKNYLQLMECSSKEVIEKLKNIIKSCNIELITSYENGLYNDIDHYTGALSNLGADQIRSKLDEEQEQGLQLIQRAIEIKLRVGNWVGVANSYNALSTYSFTKKDYKNALAYIKKDCILSEKYSSYKDLIITLLHMSNLYMEMRQMKEAREAVRRAQSLVQSIDNNILNERCQIQLNLIDQTAKKIVQDGQALGRKAPCVCGSGNSYQDCCGQADFDYNLLNDVIGLPLLPYSRLDESNMAYSHQNRIADLNRFMCKIADSETRLSFLELFGKGAYMELYELPDMSSIHLKSAQTLLENASEGNILEEISVAISVVILSISALEAFVNQLAYFLGTVNELPRYIHGKVPVEILNGIEDYQRNTRLVDKIQILFSIVYDGDWKRDSFEDYQNLNKLISLRNELVHFKSTDYHRIIPPQEENILKGLDLTIKLRDVPNAWPFKLLTLSFAEWGIRTVEHTIVHVKEVYQKHMQCQ